MISAKDIDDMLREPPRPRDDTYGRIILSPSQFAHLRRLRGYTKDLDQHIILTDGTRAEE